jgi:uncharacterized protein (TIGR02145 family)
MIGIWNTIRKRRFGGWAFVVKNWLPSFAFGVSRLAEGIVWPFRYVDSEETLPVENAKFAGNVLDIADIVSTVEDLRAVVTEWKDQSRPKRQVYGLLYNGYAAINANIAPEGYVVPSGAQWNALTDYLELDPAIDSNNVGNYLKSKRQVGSGDDPNGGAGGDFKTTTHPRWDNDATHWGLGNLGLNITPAGTRATSGSIDFLGRFAFLWTRTFSGSSGNRRDLRSNTGTVGDKVGMYALWIGYSVRFMRDATATEKAAFNDGDFVETVFDIDGNSYDTIFIGKNAVSGNGQVWSTTNLMTTKFNNGDAIPGPNFTNPAWAALVTPAYCYPDDAIGGPGKESLAWTDPSTVLINADRPEIGRDGLIAIERATTNILTAAQSRGEGGAIPWGTAGVTVSAEQALVGATSFKVTGADSAINYFLIQNVPWGTNHCAVSAFIYNPNAATLPVRIAIGGAYAPAVNCEPGKWTPVSFYRDTTDATQSQIRIRTVDSVLPFYVDKLQGEADNSFYATNWVVGGDTRPAPQVVLPFLLPRTGYVAGMVDAVSDAPAAGISRGRIFMAGTDGATNVTELRQTANSRTLTLVVYGSNPGTTFANVSIPNWYPATTGERIKFGFIAVWGANGSSLFVTNGTDHLKATNATTVINEDNYRSATLGRNILAALPENQYSSVKYHALTTGLQSTFTEQQAAKLLSELSQGFLNLKANEITFV